MYKRAGFLDLDRRSRRARHSLTLTCVVCSPFWQEKRGRATPMPARGTIDPHRPCGTWLGNLMLIEARAAGR